jgi:hypothetical protein
MPRSYDSATVELAVTLSTFAYVDENRSATQQQMASEINAGLGEAGYESAQIAFGTAIGLRQVLAMRDGTLSLESFLTAAPDGTPILITGHSLGGCLAAALAPCVANWVGKPADLRPRKPINLLCRARVSLVH